FVTFAIAAGRVYRLYLCRHEFFQLASCIQFGEDPVDKIAAATSFLWQAQFAAPTLPENSDTRFFVADRMGNGIRAGNKVKVSAECFRGNVLQYPVIVGIHADRAANNGAGRDRLD